MSPEIQAALIGLAGTLVLMFMGQLVATVFFAGRLTQKVSDLEIRTAALEKSDRAAAIERAKLEVKLETKTA
jgi:hypothetical protein